MVEVGEVEMENIPKLYTHKAYVPAQPIQVRIKGICSHSCGDFLSFSPDLRSLNFGINANKALLTVV